MTPGNHMTPGLKRVAAFCIMRCGNRFLLLKRAKPPNAGLFTPVGGKVDPYETPVSAVRREVLEETGITLGEVRLNGILTETSPIDYNWVSFVYTATIAYREIAVSAEGSLHWIAREDLHTVPTPPTDLHLYRLVIAGEPFLLDATYDEQMTMLTLREEIGDRQLHPEGV